MFPLHTFKNLFCLYLIISIFICCKERASPDLAIIEVLNETIENSNSSINTSTVDVMASLENKLYDYGYKERAKVWLSKAQLIQKISKNAYDQIDEVKLKLKRDNSKIVTEEDVLQIFDCLKNYENEILQIDPKLTHDYKQYLKIFSRSIDSTEANQKDLFKKYFSRVSGPATLALFTKLQNNIKLNEEGMIIYCNEQSKTLFCGFRYMTRPIVMQNSTILKPGEEIIITAALANHDAQLIPKIFVYNRRVQLDDDRAARYKAKAPFKPGKYYVPVIINYTDENGKQQSVQKEIEYTVANIQKQE